MPHDATGASLPELLRSLNLVLVRLGEQAERLEHEAEHREMLARAQEPPLPPPKHRTPAGQRWLYVVRGAAVPLAAAGGFARAHARYVVAGAATAAVTAGSALSPEMMAPAPAAQVPARHHHAVVHHHRPVMPVPSPAVPARRKRRRSDNDDTVRPSASVAPSASPSSTADPSPTAVPGPGPSGPVPPPAPVPDPTCTLHPGKDCHGGDVAGDAVRVLRGLPWLS